MIWFLLCEAHCSTTSGPSICRLEAGKVCSSTAVELTLGYVERQGKHSPLVVSAYVLRTLERRAQFFWQGVSPQCMLQSCIAGMAACYIFLILNPILFWTKRWYGHGRHRSDIPGTILPLVMFAQCIINNATYIYTFS